MKYTKIMHISRKSIQFYCKKLPHVVKNAEKYDETYFLQLEPYNSAAKQPYPSYPRSVKPR